MSMKNYPIEAYGLLAYAEDLQEWWDRETDGFGTDDFERQEVDLCEVNECLCGGSCTCVYDADGNTYEISDKGFAGEEAPDIGSYGEDFVILELKNYPCLFSTAYPDKMTAIAELKKSYVDILPKDFDFERRFVCYLGTELC